MKTPPPTANFASFRDNKISVYSVAELFINNSQDLTIYFSRNHRQVFYTND